MRGVQSFTIFLQVFSEDIAGLSSLGGVVQGNVSVDVLQQNIHPRLPDAGQEKAEKTQTNWVLAGPIHQTGIDDKVGSIILASQRRIPEQNHGDINRQYSELKNSLNNCLGGGAVKSEGVGYRYLGLLGWVRVTRLMCVYSTRTLPEQSSVIAWDNMGDLPSGSFNDCYSSDNTVVGHNMVMIDCFSLEELHCAHYLQKILQCFTSRAEMCTSHAKCTRGFSSCPFHFYHPLFGVWY